MKPWIGNAFGSQEKRLLILGESWYGDFRSSDEILYIQTWIERQLPGRADRFFSRIFNAGSQKSAAAATRAERAGFWSKVAFTNLVSESVGQAARIRPGDAHWIRGVRRLEMLLPKIRCDRILMLGADTAYYAESVALKLGLHAVRCRHPSGYGVASADLRSKWNEIMSK